MKNQFFKTKIFLSCFIILFCFTGMALGVIAITNFKSLNFNIAIKFNPDFYLELYYFIDNNNNNIVDENEDKILVFNNTNGFKVGDNVDIKENYLNIQTSLNENDNLKFIVINKTLNNTNDEGVNISVFINAINDANPDNLYNISYAHNIPINNETILNGKIALAGKINYKIEISQTFNVETSLQNLTVNNIYFSPLHNYETTLTAETNYDLPESCEVEILTNATNTTYTKLTTDEYTYNLSSGNLIIPTSTLNNIDYNTPTNLPLIKITASANKTQVQLYLASTIGNTNYDGYLYVYDQSTNEELFNCYLPCSRFESDSYYIDYYTTQGGPGKAINYIFETSKTYKLVFKGKGTTGWCSKIYDYNFLDFPNVLPEYRPHGFTTTTQLPISNSSYQNGQSLTLENVKFTNNALIIFEFRYYFP